MNVALQVQETPAGMVQAEALLAEFGKLLASSLDYEETLAGVAELAVRFIADFCIIDLLEDGAIRRQQAAHADPLKAGLTRELLRFPLDRSRPHLSREALETGKSVLVPEVSDQLLRQMTQNEEHRRILAELQPRSFMAVPLLARDRLLGVVLFVSSTRTYREADLQLGERLVRLAALEVDNARLFRESQQALLARDNVLRIVAHDLRNPLNAIIMSADLLRSDRLTQEQRTQQAELIARSARRMNRLIQDLLDVGRIESGQLHLNRVLLEPARLVEEIVELNQSLARVGSLSLRGEIHEELPRISADRDRILQVFSNLVGNALKFTPPGGEIVLSASSFGSMVRFSVTDTGCGIAPEDLSRLFRPFWQAERRQRDGLGLGLSIAKGIVEAHGGTIHAESSPGRGSTFWFTIPAVIPPRGGERRHGPSDRRASLTSAPG